MEEQTRYFPAFSSKFALLYAQRSLKIAHLLKQEYKF